MFKKFIKDDISSSSQLKSSAARNIKSKIITQYPLLGLDSTIDEIIPKKQSLFQHKALDFTLISADDVFLFYNIHSDQDIFYPNLLICHKYPDILPIVQVDRGAIKFLLKGADCMCPGLTSPGGSLPADLPAGTVVSVHAEGKEHALAIGILKMSCKDIKEINKGIAVQNIHFIGDGLWNELQRFQ